MVVASLTILSTLESNIFVIFNQMKTKIGFTGIDCILNNTKIHDHKLAPALHICLSYILVHWFFNTSYP